MIKKISKFISESNSILLVLLAAFVFRLFLANFGTLQLDQGTFIAWSNILQFGFKSFYNNWSDYLPGYLYILWGLGKIGINPMFQTILYKLPAIIADLITGLLIYKAISKNKNSNWGLVFSLIYLFNPAILANSTLWGQVDSLTSLFSMLSLYLFPINIYLSSVTLAIGTLIKPQAAFIAPAILYLFIKNKKETLKNYLTYILLGLSVFSLGFLPFSNRANLVQFIMERLSLSANQYPYGSVNAFSFWALQGFWKSDNLTVWFGMATAVVAILVVLYFVFKKNPKNGEYITASLSLLATFLFMTRMHERHLLPVLAPMLVAGSFNPVFIVGYLGLSLTYTANLAYSYYWITDNFKEIFNPLLIKLFTILNVSLFVTLIFGLVKKIDYGFKLKLSGLKKNLSFPGKDFSQSTTNKLLLAIIVFALITRVYSLNLPKEKYFDEVYHAFTAGLVLHNDPKAWEWWNPHPEGFAYEWTHPPLAKLGMYVGMKVFGENAFGWRIVQAVLGTATVYLVFLLAKVSFNDNKLALLSAFMFSLDGLPLVLSRIGMNDSYMLFFALLSIYLFIKDKNLFSSLAFGLAISSKWSAIYTLPILFVSHFVFKKKIKVSYIFFMFVPLVIYVLSYSVMFATGHTWDQFIEVQKQMWWYHTNLVADHPYTSPAWSWPLLLRPIYLYDGQEINDTAARIYAFGNPSVFWFGLFSVILGFFIAFQEKLKKLGFVLFSYIIFFLPWIASPRIMFLYHYLPSIPFMAIAIGFVLRRFPKSVYLVLPIATVLFFYFYPHWTGIRIPLWLDASYYWFNSWR